MEKEVRYRGTAPQIRASDDGQETHFEGHPILFNEMSVDLGDFKEIIVPEAWKTAEYEECLSVFQHSEKLVLGSFQSGTLTLEADEKGVFARTEIGPESISQDCRSYVKRGIVRGMSFKFNVRKHDISYNKELGIVIRTILEFGNIYDVSLVTNPAYTNTDANVRGLVQEVRSKATGKTIDQVAAELAEIEERKKFYLRSVLKNRNQWQRTY